MPLRFIRKIVKFALAGTIFLFFCFSCATMDKFLDTFGSHSEGVQDLQPEKKVPLPPTIKDFESKDSD